MKRKLEPLRPLDPELEAMYAQLGDKYKIKPKSVFDPSTGIEELIGRVEFGNIDITHIVPIKGQYASAKAECFAIIGSFKDLTTGKRQSVVIYVETTDDVKNAASSIFISDTSKHPSRPGKMGRLHISHNGLILYRGDGSAMPENDLKFLSYSYNPPALSMH